MKKLIFAVFVTVAAVGLFADTADAQRKTITSSEYSKQVHMEARQSYEKKRRQTTVSESLVDGVVVRTESSIYEYITGTRTRLLVQATENGRQTETEVIKIDNFTYERRNNEPWKKIEIGSAGGLSTGMGVMSLTQNTSEETFLDGQPVTLFEELRLTERSGVITFYEIKHWIGVDKLIRRYEYVRGNLHPREEKSRTVTTYEYDPPGFTIEAPIK